MIIPRGHYVRSNDVWKFRNPIIPEDVVVIGLQDSNHVIVKIGNGRDTYNELPNINHKSSTIRFDVDEGYIIDDDPDHRGYSYMNER